MHHLVHFKIVSILGGKSANNFKYSRNDFKGALQFTLQCMFVIK